MGWLVHKKKENKLIKPQFQQEFKFSTLFNLEYWLDSVYSLLVFTAFSRYYN